jgi:hypothetical protein
VVRAAEHERAVQWRDERITQLATALVDQREAYAWLQAQHETLIAERERLIPEREWLLAEREDNIARRDYLEGELASTSATLEMILETRVWRLGRRWYGLTRKLRGRY